MPPKLQRPRPPPCQWCSKSFARKESLEMHILMHLGMKPQCAECGKTFTELRHLRRHMFVHTGEDPVKCAECDQTFWGIMPLKNHMEMHKSKNCTECKKIIYQNRIFEGTYEMSYWGKTTQMPTMFRLIS